MTDNPTQRTYDSLNQAYEHFNTALFGGTLPPCLLTMQRRKGAYGYFCGGRFASSGAPTEITDEIALNPAHFATRSATSILATLVHEMTHLWQHHFGKPSRAGYHNRQWAQKMHEIGLCPVGTGRSEEKGTGQRVSYGTLEGGAFERACRAWQARGPAVLYQDRPREEEEALRLQKAESKTKYVCPGCRVKAWAKPNVSIVCGECRRTLLAAPKRRSHAAR